MAFSGDVGNHMWACQVVLPCPGGMIALPPGGSTWADPPPEIMPTSACAPITAMLEILEASSGSCECSFLSSTMLCSAIFCASWITPGILLLWLWNVKRLPGFRCNKDVKSCGTGGPASRGCPVQTLLGRACSALGVAGVESVRYQPIPG